MHKGEKITQSMVFPQDHPDFPSQQKGMKHVLKERGLWINSLHMVCKDGCLPQSNSCCATWILERQPDFQKQQSLVQETIECHGHLCIFLPKYHCELNFIEFFWGAVKRFLRENCDYTFEGLKRNMPIALSSVDIKTIRKWEHRMFRWMEAYRGGLNSKDAQLEVHKYSSRKYKSHRRVPETLARQMDK
jgi:transposase